MMRLNKILLLIFILSLVFFTGCEKNSAQDEYEKCNSVCASVLEGDYVTLELCREECKAKFLDKSK